MSDLIKKLENSIENLKEKKCKLFFFVQDTKGNGRASVSYIYNLALTLKNAGYNSIILHEKSDYFGVQDWLGSEYMEKLEHLSYHFRKNERIHHKCYEKCICRCN
jgi:hypothetical protein